MKNLPSLRAFCILSFSFCLFAACNHYHYVPNQQNVPGFTEKGEYRFAVGQSNGQDYSGWDGQLAWAPLKHVGVMANGFYASGAKNGEDDEKGHGYLGEAAVGVWWPLRHQLVAEGYYGFGVGKLSNSYSNGPVGAGVHNYDLQRGFGQLSLTRRMPLMEYGASLRITGLYFSNLTINGAHIPGTTDEGWFYLAEPNVFVGGGGQRLKVILSLSRSYELVRATLDGLENYNFGFSVQYRFGGKANRYPEDKKEQEN